MLLEFQQLRRKLNVGLQVNLCVLAVRLCITGMLLDVQADRGSRAACAGETDDDAGSVGELNVKTLVG
jgi:hypothetical protein